MSNCTDRDARRQWVQRIIDHDGTEGDDGGIEAWLQLAEAVGLSREETLSYKHVLPGVKFAIYAYINFNRDKFSISKKNVLRGFHGDKKTWKLITCLRGEILCVVVDYRSNSKNYLINLSSDNIYLERFILSSYYEKKL